MLYALTLALGLAWFLPTPSARADTEPGPTGIITAAQIPAAMAALQAAVAADEALTDAQEPTDDEAVERPDTVRLHQRAAPFLEMLRRSVAQEHDVVWGA